MSAPAMTQPLYDVRGLRRCFGGREVLHIPELVLDCGNIYGLLGPNGAGKTTLMRLLAFMDTPTEGRIRFNGQEVAPDQQARYRARVVWVPQSPVLFTGTLLYNIEYPMRLKRVPQQARRAKAHQLLESVGLAHLAGAPARKLSGGEAQRGSIARALAAGAEVLLFDEPTASVDFRSRAEIIQLIGQLWRERGLSVIVTTHDKDLADELCREQITLFDGKIVSRVSGVAATSALPQGARALPGRLLPGPSGPVAHLPAGTALLPGAAASGPAVLLGLAESGGGVVMRLGLGPGNVLDLLVTKSDDVRLAKQLTLETRIQVTL